MARQQPETNLDLVAETTRLRENKEPVASSARHAQIAAAKGPATTTPENKLIGMVVAPPSRYRGAKCIIQKTKC